MNYIKFFENFQTPAYSNRTGNQILSEQNLEDLSSKLNFIRKFNDLPQDFIKDIIMVLETWCEQKLGFMLSGTEGSGYQSQIKGNKEQIIDDVKLKLEELRPFVSTGKYYDETLSDMIGQLVVNL